MDDVEAWYHIQHVPKPLLCSSSGTHLLGCVVEVEHGGGKQQHQSGDGLDASGV